MKNYFETRKDLLAKAQGLLDANDFDGFNAVKAEIEQLDTDHEKAMIAKANLTALSAEPTAVTLGQKNGTTADLSGVALATTINEDKFATNEYRTAFMNNVLSGVAIPSAFTNANAQTTTSDVGSVIPTTIVNRIVEKMETIGKLWTRITKMSYQGGVSVPTSSVKPSASWVSERSTADTQKKTTSSITFTYNKLICKVAISFEVSVVTLEVFEATVADNIATAMIKAIEKAAISGTGSGQPKGVLSETVVTGQNVDIARTSSITYKDVAKMEGALPQAYDDGAVWCMTKPTFLNNFVGMVDANGRPIMREVVGTNGKPMYYILGREVVIVDNDYMSSYADTVASDTVFAFIFNWSDYVGNTNYSVTMREYIDEDTDDRVKKALMLFDAKAADINSLVTMTKKSA